jgi:hypothetical protein
MADCTKYRQTGGRILPTPGASPGSRPSRGKDRDDPAGEDVKKKSILLAAARLPVLTAQHRIDADSGMLASVSRLRNAAIGMQMNIFPYGTYQRLHINSHLNPIPTDRN